MIVNVFSAEESRGSFEAVHVRDLDLETPEQFQSDWEDALEKISQADPEWNVCDIEDEMKNRGWALSEIVTVKVEY
jgi:hypothetical protein